MKPLSLASPFRIGGRGSKQLSKAIEKSNSEKEKAGVSASYENTFALCTGSSPCFAKILSSPSQDSYLIQPMHPNDLNTSLFVPWDGLVWLAKKAILYPVTMKQELGGWRVQYTSELYAMMQHAGINVQALQQPQRQPNQLMSVTMANVTKKDWDVVTLEGSDLEDCSSVDSLLFPKSVSRPATTSTVSIAPPAPVAYTSSAAPVSTSSPDLTHYRYHKLSAYQSPKRYDCSPISTIPAATSTSSNGWAKMHFGVPLSPPVSTSSKKSTPGSSVTSPNDLSPPKLLTDPMEPYPMTAVAVITTAAPHIPSEDETQKEVVDIAEDMCASVESDHDDDVKSTDTWCQEDSTDNAETKVATSIDEAEQDNMSSRICDASPAVSSPVQCADELPECNWNRDQSNPCDDCADAFSVDLSEETLDVAPRNCASDIVVEVADYVHVDNVESEQIHISDSQPNTSETPLGEETQVSHSTIAQEDLHSSSYTFPQEDLSESNCTGSSPIVMKDVADAADASVNCELSQEVPLQQNDGGPQSKQRKRRRRSEIDGLVEVVVTNSPVKRACGIADLPKTKSEKSAASCSPVSVSNSGAKPPLRTKRTVDEAPRVLPSRSARAKSGDYSSRDAFLGSWPTRHQAFATGTWEL